MKSKYRIKEVRNEYGTRFYIQRKTLFGFWLNQFGERFVHLDTAKSFLKAKLQREVIFHEVEL